VDDGVLVRAGVSAGAWNTPERLAREKQLLQDLGEQYFFSKDDVTRLTTAPPLPLDD
jgi:hypothetical protein